MLISEFKDLLSKMTLDEWTDFANEQLEIDIFNLEKNIAMNCIYLSLWSSIRSDEKFKLKNLELMLSKIKAEKFLHYAMPEDGKKPSDKMLAAYVDSDNDVNLLTRDIIIQWQRVDKIDGIVKSFEGRGYLLKEEKELWERKYYSDENEEVVKELNKRLTERKNI